MTKKWRTKREIVPIRRKVFILPCRIQNPLINYTRMYERVRWRARWAKKCERREFRDGRPPFILLIKHRATELGVINWRVGCARPTPRFFPRSNFSKRKPSPEGGGKKDRRDEENWSRGSRARFTELNGLFRGIFHGTGEACNRKFPACTLLQIESYAGKIFARGEETCTITDLCF